LRRLLIIMIVAIAPVAGYVGSAIWSVNALSIAVRAGNTAEIVRQTDIPRLRNSLVAQVVDAYLDRIGAARQMQRAAVAMYGPSIADPLIGKILDEGLTRLLREGVVQDPTKPAAPGSAQVSLAPFGAIAPGEIIDLASRIRPFKLLEFDLRISPSDDPRIYTAARFRLEGVRWKLAGLTIPPAVAADIAAMIVEPARR
jgi:hypothetical protein